MARGTAVGVLGLGAVSAVGLDVPAIRAAARSGTSGVRRVQRFDTSMFTGPWAGEVDIARLRTRAPAAWRDADPCTLMALDAAGQAWAEAGVRAEPARIALVLGTSAGNHNTEDLSEERERSDPTGAFRQKEAARHWTTAAAIADVLGIAGPRLTVSSACASGNLAIAAARELILTGAADVVLAGGADAISPRRFAGFDALGVIGAEPGAPFSHPMGMNVGEGAAFVVLGRDPVDAIVWLAGSGGSCDAWHATAPEPGGAGVARSLRAALEDAGVEPGDVGLLSAHATGTEANDAAEWRAVEAVFGDRAAELPWLAAKAVFGHSFGAAGALETVLVIDALTTDTVPPPARWTRPRALGPQAPGGPRPGVGGLAVGTNAAFGGANASLVWCRERRESSRDPREVRLAGVGSLLGGPGREPEPGVTRAALRRAARGLDPRTVDPPAAWLCVAVGRALADAGVRPRGADRDRVGILGAACRRSVRTSDAIRRSVDQRGLTGLSAVAFSRTVLNAPQGAAARTFGLRGPTTTLATAPGVGLFAAVLAVRALRWRRDADRLVVAGVDEIDPSAAAVDPGNSRRERTTSSWPGLGGAAAAVFSTVDEGPVVLGTGLSGRLEDAVREAVAGRAVGGARGVSGTVDADSRLREQVASLLPDVPWEPASQHGVGDSAGGLLALDGAAGLLLVAEHPGVGAAALLLGQG